MSQMKFLAVDDSPTMRRILVNTLKRIGHEHVTEAVDGRDAIAKLSSEKFDFIITDWNMPNMNGLELLQAIRSNPDYEETPVLMITTRGVKEDIIEAMKAGASSYIVKPFTPKTLKEKITAVLETCFM